MPDLPEADGDEGPDPNDVRRHAKRMLTELEYRKKYRRLDFYRPNRKQLLFHNTDVREKLLRGGNQMGKTQGAGAEMAMHALAYYPEWFTGRRFEEPPRIERQMDFLGWAGSTTSVATRDGIQLKLFGDIRESGGLGTGLIPLDNIIGRPTMARGISDFIDSAILRRENGGKAVIRQKTGEMERRAWQGEAVDVVWIDEDTGEWMVYSECLARLTTTNGIIIVSMTPMLGATPIRKRFKASHPGTADVILTIDDALVSAGGHIPDERKVSILEMLPERERQTRAYGADMQGEGAVFDTPVGEIKHSKDPATFPGYWPWMWALDFRHSGSATSGHPFAAVLGAWDRDNDTIYVVHAIRMLGLAVQHVAAIKESPMWNAPVAWPHDGGRGASILSGETVAQAYRKLGLHMRPMHATFKDGGYNFEAGIADMEGRFATGRLKVAAHLSEVFDEYLGYHRINGLVNKVDDDLLSAIRVLCMDIRNAQPPGRFRGFLGVPRDKDRDGGGGIAAGTNFDLFTGAA